MKILVIQTHDIGDVLITTALCDALKIANPEAVIDFFVEDRCVGVVEGNPNIDEKILLSKKKRSNLFYSLGLLRYVRSKKYDYIINVQGQTIGLFTCLFSLSSRRIGFSKIPWQLAHTDNIDRQPERVKQDVQGQTERKASGLGFTIDRRFQLLDPIDKDIPRLPFKLWLSEDEIIEGKNLLTSAGVDMSKPLVALGINAQHSFKRWPMDHFIHITDWLIEQYGSQMYLYFGPGEEAYSKIFKKKLAKDKQPYVFDNIHTKNIRQLAQVFHHCSFYMGNETGPRHIAQALDIPAFAVVSPSSNKWSWIPWDNPRFQAVDTGDALDMSAKEWNEFRLTLTNRDDHAQWFARISPEFVRSRLQMMLHEVEVFSDMVDQ